MAYIEWTPEFDVHDAEMNSQHRKLFGYVNDYNEAFESDAGKAALVAALDRIIEYTVYHFRDEEALMDRIGFDGARHKLIHRQLESQVTDFRGKLDAGEDVGQDIKFFLKNWLSAHIKGIDTKYGQAMS